MNNIGKVVSIGGANIDRKGICENIVKGSSTPVSFFYSFGGVARNVAVNLARTGTNVSLITFVGNDNDGSAILNDAEKEGVDTSFSVKIKGEKTGNYTAILNGLGEMEFAFADMNIYDEVTKDTIADREDIIKKASIVFADCNLSEGVLNEISTICSKNNIEFVVDLVSIAKSSRVKNLTGNIYTLICNYDEASALAETNGSMEDVALKLLASGIKNVVITMGSKGVFFSNGIEKGTIPAEVTKVIDVTGAGDAMISGIIYGLMRGTSFEKAVRYGIKAASVTIASKFTVADEMSHEIFDN